MDLFETVGSPVPPDAILSDIGTSDGLRLRVARWSNQGARGTVTIAIGRGEFIEQYYDVVRAILARQFDAVIFDWRGQGQSDREIAPRKRGHVSSFAAYRRDLAAVEAEVLKDSAPRPWFALGHSMGAAILLDQAHDGTSPFDRLILSAPMIDVPLRYRTAKRMLIRLMDALGLGTWLIPGGSEMSPMSRGFDSNLLTRDPRQYMRLARLIEQFPQIAVGSPTVRWLSSAFNLMERFSDPRFSVATMVPTLIIAAGADRIVDTAATERFAIRLKAGRCVTLPDARHQLMMERDTVQAQFWAAFDAFIPGTTEQDRAARAGRFSFNKRWPARIADQYAR